MIPAEFMTPELKMRRAAEILWGGIARWRVAVLDGMSQHPSVKSPNRCSGLGGSSPSSFITQPIKNEYLRHPL